MEKEREKQEHKEEKGEEEVVIGRLGGGGGGGSDGIGRDKVWRGQQNCLISAAARQCLPSGF